MPNPHEHPQYKYLDTLCWEGFAKVLEFAASNYPSNTKNKSLVLLLDDVATMSSDQPTCFIKNKTKTTG